MDCVVIKPFLGGGVDYVQNQLVDAMIFRNASSLISQRYLRPATQDEINSAYADEPAKPSVPKKKPMMLRRKKS